MPGKHVLQYRLFCVRRAWDRRTRVAGLAGSAVSPTRNSMAGTGTRPSELRHYVRILTRWVSHSAMHKKMREVLVSNS